MNDMRGNTVVAHLTRSTGRRAEEDPRDGLHRRQQPGRGVAQRSRTPSALASTSARACCATPARAACLGVPLNFVQGSAGETDFPDNSFDLVYSSALLHRDQQQALPRIMAECLRAEAGGVMIHLEVPFRAEMADAFDPIRADYETRYNNEPFWMGRPRPTTRCSRRRPASPTSTPGSRMPRWARRRATRSGDVEPAQQGRLQVLVHRLCEGSHADERHRTCHCHRRSPLSHPQEPHRCRASTRASTRCSAW